jgi:NADH-quinone oxidoreductase subunit A
MADYLGFLFVLIVAIILGLALPVLHQLLGPSRPKEKKLMPYESGMDPVGTARERFSVKFYLVAMLFIIFDVEVIFMYPWAAQYKELTNQFGMFPFIEMLVFILILLVGYIYLYKKEGFKWD